jgi:hypothetical protein
MTVTSQSARKSIALIALPILLAGEAKALSTIFIAPSDAANGSASIPTVTLYTSNLGYAFISGASGPFDIEGMKLSLTSGSISTSTSFKISIHGTDNTTPYSAVANSTVYASDTVSFTTPGTANTPFDLNLTAADLPNISNYQLLSNTAYSLIVNGASPAVALRRTQGYADQTTNTKYTVGDGFTMLDTFRNNTPNYSNSSGSYPTFHISLLGSSPGPTTPGVPGPLPILGALAGFRASRLLRKRMKAKI